MLVAQQDRSPAHVRRNLKMSLWKKGPRVPRRHAEDTDYEKQRAITVMKNNQMRQRLGLSQLRSMMASILSGRMNDAPPQESGSLYDGDDIEGSDDEMVSKESLVDKVVRSHTPRQWCRTLFKKIQERLKGLLHMKYNNNQL